MDKINYHRLFERKYLFSLGHPRKDRQRFFDAIVLIPTPDWSNRLSNFENFVEMQFESVFEH